MLRLKTIGDFTRHAASHGWDAECSGNAETGEVVVRIKRERDGLTIQLTGTPKEDSIVVDTIALASNVIVVAVRLMAERDGRERPVVEDGKLFVVDDGETTS